MAKPEDDSHSNVTSLAKPRNISGYSIYEIWGGMTGAIWVFHSAWNHNRVVSDILRQFDRGETKLGKSLRERGVERETLHKVVNTITQYGNLMVEGDMIGMDHILSLLRFLYPPEEVLVRNAWLLGLEADEVRENKLFRRVVENSNVVLLCGPRGNLATRILLEKRGLSWLFDLGGEYLIRTHSKKGRILSPAVGKSGNLLHDYGVFLKCRNPFNPSKWMYAAMGAHAYGTQGATALACSEESGSELVSVPVDKDIESLGVKYIAWIRVWRPSDTNNEEEIELKEFSDPKLKYGIEHPAPPEGKKNWKSHSNPSRIRNDQSKLRSAALLESTVFLGSRPSTLFAYTFFLVSFVAALCTLLIKVTNIALLSVLILITGIGTAKTFVSILMPRKSHRRAKKEGKIKECPRIVDKMAVG